MSDIPEPLEYSDYRGRRNIDEKLDEIITTVNEIIEYLESNAPKSNVGDKFNG